MVNLFKEGKIVAEHSKGMRLYLPPALAMKLGRRVLPLLLPCHVVWEQCYSRI